MKVVEQRWLGVCLIRVSVRFWRVGVNYSRRGAIRRRRYEVIALSTLVREAVVHRRRWINEILIDLRTVRLLHRLEKELFLFAYFLDFTVVLIEFSTVVLAHFIPGCVVILGETRFFRDYILTCLWRQISIALVVYQV